MNGALQPSPNRPLSIYLVAAEASGDALGAALAQALLSHEAGAVKLSGVGGHAMAAVWNRKPVRDR